MHEQPFGSPFQIYPLQFESEKKNDTMYQKEEFEDTKEIIRIRKSKKNGQYNGLKKKYKQQSTIHTHKTFELN
jgi:adenylate cyclase class IV